VYVAGWVADDATPSWEEAMARLDHLHEHGSSPQAFDFKAPFDAAGNPATIRRFPAPRLLAGGKE
jgi:hypothetical protein